ncbi:cellular tumor antigen p53-like isoform X2 [Eriocheir sinensis]|nr:cellular tumor antigen p53-like isoform X2 [Eriocheir sinensis]XP_050710949.1 cellular tumor antigen p53-like isoform X2 [Eriocheir sinensis]
MKENQQDPEPLFDEADYLLLRNDSLLNRMGSNNFASIIEGPAVPAPENDVSLQQLQHQPFQLPQQQQMPEVPFLQDTGISDPLFIGSDLLTFSPSELHLDPTESWNQVEMLQCENENDNLSSLLAPEAPVARVDGNSSTSRLPDSTPTQKVPSLQAWPGQYGFEISLPVENKDRNKWCFSTEKNKLYLCPYVAVPVNVKLLQFIDASITITPVFKDSRHRVHPVVTCYNCKSKMESDNKDHMVMVEGVEGDYKMVNERFVVSVPLHPPPPGEAASTLLVRMNCLTSCVGGPNRRPFCLVFTLHDNAGIVIGRQILDLKCCKCPSRDLLHEEKTALRGQECALPSHLPGDRVQAPKRKAPTTTTEKKRVIVKLEPEPATERRIEHVTVPDEFWSEVKMYVKTLVLADCARQNKSDKSDILLLLDEN